MDYKGHLKKAKEIIDCDSSENYIYACLQLRLFIESYVYFEISKYKKYIPEKSLKVWQPAKIIKITQQLIPECMADFEFSLIKQSNKGTRKVTPSLGNKHYGIKVNKLSRLYHKLGNKIHAPKNFEENHITKKFLKEIYSLLEPLCRNDIWFTMREVVNFNCAACCQQIPINVIAMSSDSNTKVYCYNEECQATYLIHKDSNNIFYEPLITELQCKVCDQYIEVLDENLKIGYEINCLQCNKLYVICWGYTEKVDEVGSHSKLNNF